METSAVIGVDVGTSAVKAVIVGVSTRPGRQRVLATAEEPYQIVHPRPGWSEQDPRHWYTASCSAITSLLRSSEVAPSAVRCVAFDGPAHCVALLDQHGGIIRPTIHWSDTRAAADAAAVASTHGDEIIASSLHEVDPAWTLAQLHWLRRVEPASWARLRRIAAVKDYVRLRFTGEFVTDAYDAVGTQLFDVRTNTWSPSLIELIGLPPTALPALRAADEIAGGVSPSAARDTGLRVGTPVAVGTSDTLAEALAVDVTAAGDWLVKVGSSANVSVVSTTPRHRPGLLTYPHVAPGAWMLIAATSSGASSMRWLRSTLFPTEDADESNRSSEAYEVMERYAAAAPVASSGLLFHPYLDGERSPRPDARRRGDFLGLSTAHSSAHVVRAVMEGVAFSLRDCMESLATTSTITSATLIGGGARSRLWSSIVASVLGCELRRVPSSITPIGSAGLAARACGLSDGVDVDLGSDMISPQPDAAAIYRDMFQIYRRSAADLAHHSHALADLADRVLQLTRLV